MSLSSTISILALLLAFAKGEPQFNNFGNTEVGLQIGATGAVFNNHAGARIGTVNATIPTAQNLSQTITSTGVVGTTIPLVPATMVNPGMTMPGMTMVNPWMTMVNPWMTMPGMTMVNPWMTMATSGLVGNIGKQIGVQKVATNGTFNNIGSQIGIQVGRKKRAAQFNNLGSQIGQQIDQSQNFNFGPMMNNWGGYRFGGGYRGFGGSQFNNYGSQIGQQFGRKKRSAQFNNWGSQIGQQISGGYGGYGYYGRGVFGGYGGGQFNNFGSQIGQQFGRKKRSPKLQPSIYY